MRVFRIQSNARLVISPVFQRLKGIACSIGFRVSCRNIGVRIAHGVTLNAVKLADYVNIAHDAEISHSSIGKRTSIGRYAKVRDAEVGPYCSISWNVTLGAVSHPIERLSTHAFTYRKQFGIVDKDVPQTAKTIRIGHDVWIGCDCVVMPGISIGGGRSLAPTRSLREMSPHIPLSPETQLVSFVKGSIQTFRPRLTTRVGGSGMTVRSKGTYASSPHQSRSSRLRR